MGNDVGFWWFGFVGSQGQLELNDPPLPPTQPSGDAENPTPYETKFYSPHRAADEPIRQLVINRLGVFGKTGFDSSASAAAQAKARDTLAEALEREGRAPVRVEEGWQPVSPSLDPQDPTFAVELTPETLEQHPVFRRIVKQCRELFGTALSMISVRLVFFFFFTFYLNDLKWTLIQI